MEAPLESPPRGPFSGASFGTYWSPSRGGARSRLSLPASPPRASGAAPRAAARPDSLGSLGGRLAKDGANKTPASVYDAIAKAERRARDAERWAKETVADVRGEMSQRAPDEPSRHLATELSGAPAAPRLRSAPAPQQPLPHCNTGCFAGTRRLQR